MTDHLSQIRDVLKKEAAAIDQMAARLEAADVERAIELLAACRGQVVLAGVGKSGFIARKIAATLTSMGTRSVFLHPSDALHGDIGIVSAEDVVVLLSSSGETDEMIAMLPYLKHRTVPLIAIVGNLESTLARQADVALDASVDKEVCPLNLAPTTSTTVALALGDALAVTLMMIKGLTPEDFAVNHPAGQLGKRLSLRVCDLMHGDSNNPTISPVASLLDVVTTMTRCGLGAVNVINGNGELAGIITDGDLRRAIQRIGLTDLQTLKAETLMTREPVTVKPATLAYDALQLMENRASQISVLPVVNGSNHCVGLLRLHDIVRSGL